MKITNSSISLGTQHVLTKDYVQTDFLTLLNESQAISRQNLQASRSIIREIYDGQTHFNISAINIVKQQENIQRQTHQPQLPDLDRQKLAILERILFLLTGKRVRFWIVQNLNNNVINGQNSEGNIVNASFNGGSFFERKLFYKESENLTFNAKGAFKTSDGKTFNFNTQVNLSREFLASNEVKRTPGTAMIDPLVINFSGSQASLTSTKFSFDLDLDGSPEQIPFIGEGSGFLALDLNSDNKINNGSELFGPVSQNGFTELAKYDIDQNEWIDENDPIYDRLRIWTKDADGKDSLFSLGQKGIGAIYLGNVNANFGLKDGENNALGQVQKMGLFVKEDGQIGSLQQIDLVV